MSRLALTLLLLAATPILAAPVPPPPRERELTPEALFGSWRYSWGQNLDGRITFHRDFTYWSHHGPEWRITHVGTWRVDGNTVTLTEYSVQTGGGLSGPTEYPFTLCPRALTGKTPGGFPVTLSEQER